MENRVALSAFQRKEAVKRAFYYACAGVSHVTGAERLRGLSSRPGTLRVLMYHKVNDQRGNSLSVPTSLFDEQMAYLQQHYRVVSVPEVLSHLAGGDLPQRAVLLTFDDGYLDIFTNALPILKRYKHKAAIFVSTDFIERPASFPHDSSFRGFDNRTLSWEHLRAMSDVFEVGSHACTHRRLTAIAPAKAHREILESKAVIESQLGRPVVAFSYPKGGVLDFNPLLRERVIEAGYRLCFTTLPRTNAPPLPPYDLARYNVEPYGPFYFARLLEGSCDLMGLGATPIGAHLKRAIVSLMGAATE